MTALQIGDANVHAWVKSFLPWTHGTVVKTVAFVLVCLLVA